MKYRKLGNEMSVWKWLNPKRLRDYPRLILFSSSSVLLLNILLGHGWVGGLTGLLMWGDFLDYYSAGLLYKKNIGQLYNIEIQEITQRNLIAPSVPSGVSFFGYPPNSAQLFSIFSSVSLPVSLGLWCLISIYCVILSTKIIHQYLIPSSLVSKGLSRFQLSIVVFSCFAFVEGFIMGQIHTLILLLIVLLLVATMKEKWFLAGILAGLLTIKPQLVIGFILIWIVWKKLYPILVFFLFSIIWHLTVLIPKGINPYIAYMNITNNLIYLPYIKEGFPLALQSTPYAFIASIISIKFASIWSYLYLIIIIGISTMFGFLAYRANKVPETNKNIILAQAILLPLIISPYGLLHDLLLLFPVIILLIIDYEDDKDFLLLVIGVYFAMLVLPLASFLFRIALTGLIPISIFFFILKRSLRFSNVITQ